MDENYAITYAITNMTKNYKNALKHAALGNPVNNEMRDIWNLTNMDFSPEAKLAVVKKGIELISDLSKSGKLGENAKNDAAAFAADLRERLDLLERSKNAVKIITGAGGNRAFVSRDRLDGIAILPISQKGKIG